ncbi:NADH pyrophosphatase, decaps 5'-NAD modified RNA [hydrothermal vent metagenome]|uniref:NAD(+) diphosphatase n=1 Tax=hydrothermal vent metagenome TaxID=652676 RepID=A0A3B0XSY3_9ZZZZ
MIIKNTSTNHCLDRTSAYRSDEAWITEKLYDEKTHIIPVHNLNMLCTNTPDITAVYLTHKDFDSSADLINNCVFLGIYNETPCFSVDINTTELASKLCRLTGATFENFKSVATLLDTPSSELLALARFMSFWHSRNLYCGKCGHKTNRSESGHVRICQNELCKEHYYPNMDPAIIVLVTSGNRCLLGRQQNWKEGMYSTLAGFVEPGETIEQAVVREIQEEAGITVHNIEYQGSQSWLFPNSLMLGFSAIAKDESITLDTNELEDARWFSPEQIRSDPLVLPYQNSIAYTLITAWLENFD